MNTRPIDCKRAAGLPAILQQRIVSIDAAMGTMIQHHKLGEADFRGERFASHPKDLKGNIDLLVLTRSGVIGQIHEQYLAAGADLIETNTFGATSIAQEDHGLARHAREINVAAAPTAREACEKLSTPDTLRFVAGVLGPRSNAHGPNDFLQVPYGKRLAAAVAQGTAACP